MNVAFVGSREYRRLQNVVDAIWELPFLTATVVSGGARGVDQMAEEMGRKRGLTVISFRPEQVIEDGLFQGYGIFQYTFTGSQQTGLCRDPEWPLFSTWPQAAYFRNNLIVKASASVKAFWDGKSRGTYNSIQHALAEGRHLEVIPA